MGSREVSVSVTGLHPNKIRRTLGPLLLGLLAWLAPAATGTQVDAKMVWVEVEAALGEEGEAMVQYKIRWRVDGGTMGGFYFQGERARLRWHEPGCGALLADGSRIDLDIKDLGNRYDILLAGGRRYGPGEITFVLTYFADYGACGYLDRTTSAEHGELVGFNWPPVQRNDCLNY